MITVVLSAATGSIERMLESKTCTYYYPWSVAAKIVPVVHFCSSHIKLTCPYIAKVYSKWSYAHSITFTAACQGIYTTIHPRGNVIFRSRNRKL